MNKIIFYFAILFASFTAFLQSCLTATAAEDASASQPTPLFRVLLGHEQPQEIFILGTQHNLQLKDVHPIARAKVETLAQQEKAYFVGERRCAQDDAIYQKEIFDIVMGHANIERYKSKLPAGKLFSWQSGLSTSLLSFKNPSAWEVVQMVFTDPRTQNFFLPMVHPVIAKSHLMSYLEESKNLREALKQEPQYKGRETLDAQVEQIFKVCPAHYLETNEELLKAYTPIAVLEDSAEFNKAFDWFQNGCPDEEEEVNPLTTVEEITDLYIHHPTLVLSRGELLRVTNQRNRSWEQKVPTILEINEGATPLFAVGLAHLGGETGMFKIFKRLGRHKGGAQIEQLWSNDKWQPVDMAEDLFSTLPPEASHRHKDIFGRIKKDPLFAML